MRQQLRLIPAPFPVPPATVNAVYLSFHI